MPKRFFLELSYRGTNFHGWQRQHNAGSVQEHLEKALSEVLRQPSYVLGCGRTDTGVHAAQYFAHFDLSDEAGIPPSFLAHLNSLCGRDLAVHALHPVHESAHARFDAVQRAYDYFLHLNRDPFREGLSTTYPFLKLNVERMNEAAALLLRQQSFGGFQKTGSDAKTAICRLDQAVWEPLSGDFPPQMLKKGSGEAWVFRIAADRFLRGMVRMVVGALLEVGRGRISVEQFGQTIAAEKRFDRMTAAPPDGLYLSRVHYPYLNPRPA